MENKYFIVNDKTLAEVMRVILGQKYYEWSDGCYTFVRTKDINGVYGQAKNIIKIFEKER